jgi:hypothetical protein
MMREKERNVLAASVRFGNLAMVGLRWGEASQVYALQAYISMADSSVLASALEAEWRRDYRHIQKSVTGLAGHEHAHFALGKPQIPQSLVKFSKGGLEMYLSV